MAKMFSKSRLVPFLVERQFIASAKQVSYEAYGRKVCAYIGVDNMVTRGIVERALIAEGQRVSESYHPGHPTVCTEVTYFRAWHWDE